jgi:hypothetical protein
VPGDHHDFGQNSIIDFSNQLSERKRELTQQEVSSLKMKVEKEVPDPQEPSDPSEKEQEEELSIIEETNQVFESKALKPFSDKEFSKAMSKIKDRVHGTQPPKRPSSAYILYQKEVSFLFEYMSCRNALKS